MEAVSPGAEAQAGVTEMVGFLPWKPEVVWLWDALILSSSPPLFSAALLSSLLLLVYFLTLSFHSLHLSRPWGETW